MYYTTYIIIRTFNVFIVEHIDTIIFIKFVMTKIYFYEEIVENIIQNVWAETESGFN